MDERTIQILISGTEQEVSSCLLEFNAKHAETLQFPDVSKSDKEKTISGLIAALRRNSVSSSWCYALKALRILSRDKTDIDTLETDQVFETLLEKAKLQKEEASNVQHDDTQVIVEAQKCLNNLVYNSKASQAICCTNNCIPGILARLKSYRDLKVEHEIKFFDMRLLFLLTALQAHIRSVVGDEMHGLSYLVDVLHLTLRDAEEKNAPLTDNEVEICCEILKILFNLTVYTHRDHLDEEQQVRFLRLVRVLHDLLIVSTCTKEKRNDLQSHTVNLLTNMPRDAYEELLCPVNNKATDQSNRSEEDKDNLHEEYEGMDMAAIVSLIRFLEDRLVTRAQQNLKERLTPILHCLCECCRGVRLIRKFCRKKILPFLKNEVLALPEEGQSLRNLLCRLLTNPLHDVKDLAADFLFVLCKENVARFVKYTGFGNAAGLLAQRGLLGGGRGAEYSSPSEESDTEEYSNLRNDINPVTGRWEEQKKNPMDDMTDEQKEYEAIQLVNAIDKLHRKGYIQPAHVGPDGRPQPVEHVIQLLSSDAASGTVTSPHNDEEDDVGVYIGQNTHSRTENES